MARIKLVDAEVVAASGAGSLRNSTRVTNHARLYANAPFLTRLLNPFSAAIQREGLGSVLSCRIKEMVVIKTSHINGCSYCYAHNTAIGEAAGITHEQVLAIGSDDYMTSPHLSPRERAAVLWAEHVTRNTAKDRDDVFEEVARHFDDTEILELTLVCAMFNFTNRVHDSLKLELEPPSQRKAAIKIDPNNMKAFIQKILDAWPLEFPEPNPD